MLHTDSVQDIILDWVLSVGQFFASILELLNIFGVKDNIIMKSLNKIDNSDENVQNDMKKINMKTIGCIQLSLGSTSGMSLNVRNILAT